jgi:hypothetical protein
MSHTTPEEADAIGAEVRGKTFVASHLRTISSLSDEPMFESPSRFNKPGVNRGFSEKIYGL